MFRKFEIDRLNHTEACYLYLLAKIKLYRLTLDKITLYRTHNKDNRLVSTIICYMRDKKDGVKIETFYLYDSDYMWFINEFPEDFPDIDIVDLTDEMEKIKNV